jgi:CRP/FNR family transcriptional regulator, cyclic AMP receptor protein
MVENTFYLDCFKQRLRDSLLRETRDSHSVKIGKHSNVYTCGERDETVYFIESGRVKLLTVSPEGKECLLSIYASGDIFGELCLFGLDARMETATAMEETLLKQIPCSKFLLHLSSHSLLEGFVRYLTARIADQQEVISVLTTADCEHRLGKILLQLARKLGRKDPRSIRLTRKISHEELSKMVGTTRPRITEFMQRFREMGLIEMSREHLIIVKEEKLMEYISKVA